MSVFKMPSLGADMEAGTLVEWLVKPGDSVAHGDVIAVVETHKGAIEIESFDTGIVERLDVQVGESVPVGTPMAVIRNADEAPDAQVTTPDTGKIPPQEVAADADEQTDQTQDVRTPDADKQLAHKQEVQQPGIKPAIAAPAAGTRAPQLASPAARTRAAEAGIDLSDITGTGPGGAVLLADVEQWLAQGKTSSAIIAQEVPADTHSRHPVKQGLDMAMMRQAIATAMSRSKREIPHYYLSHRMDLQIATDWLAARNAACDPEQRLLMGALFVKATALAVANVPELNGTFENDVFTPSEVVNCGLVVAMRGGGLIAPAVLDAGAKTLDELMSAMRDLVARTRTGRLRNSEITRGTITVSSMGETGCDSLLGVIYPPQVALVGFGTPARRAWIVDDQVLVRNTVAVTLAADHRVSDGRRGARLLTEIERLLKEPDQL